MNSPTNITFNKPKIKTKMNQQTNKLKKESTQELMKILDSQHNK